MALLLLSTLVAALAAPAQAEPARWHPGRFYPGRDDTMVELGADGRVRPVADPTARGTPALPTGEILLRTSAPDAIARLPGVASLQALDRMGRVFLLQPADGVDSLALSRQLWARPDVAWSHPDLILDLQPTALPLALLDDPYLSAQWHLDNDGSGGRTPGEDIDAPTAWAASTGAGELIAIVDSGVDADHPDLRVFNGYDYVDDDADPAPGKDSSGPHGTACSGLAAAAGDNGIGVAGVAYDADIYAIRLIGGGTTLSDLYDAFADATDAGVGVLSNSWTFDVDCGPFNSYGTLEDALLYAEEEGRGGLGAVVVTSAGNGGCDISEDGFLSFYTVIGVAASNSQALRESYSSYGDHVDITAPAGGVLTTDISGDAGYGSYAGDPDYWDGMSGTSASSPIVAGVVALMLAANPRITAREVRDTLCWTAEPIDVEGTAAGGSHYDETGWSPYYGCGRVDAGAAVMAVANGPPEAPQLNGPGAEAPVERVLLHWEAAADPDHDWLDYQLRWSVDGAEPTVETVSGTRLDLTGQVAVGATVAWELAAVDAWGAGAAATGSFVVVDAAVAPAAETAGGCSSTNPRAARGGAGVGFLLVGLGLVLRRRVAVTGGASRS